MAWRLKQGKPLGGEFRRVALEEAKRARSLLTAAEPPNDQAIHQARRSFKKLRALMRLAEPSLGASFNRENRRWRDAGRLLSAARDASVLLGSFDRLAEQAKLSPKKAAALRARLAAVEPPKASGAGEARPVAEALALVDAALRDIPKLNWPRDPGEVGRGLRDSQRRLKRSWKTAKREGGSEELHDWRKRVKDASSHLGLFRAALPAELQTSRDEAKALAAMLGEEHDLALLRDKLSAETIPAALRASASVIVKAADERRAALRTAALDKGEALSTRSAKAVAEDVMSRWQGANSDERQIDRPQAERRRA